MNSNRNMINGQLPQIGNPLHIAYVKSKARVMSGGINFHTITWNYCHYWGGSTDTNKPKYRYEDPKNADAVVDHIPCPKCGRLHVLLVAYDPQGNWYDELIDIDASVKEFACWNCHTEFETDDDRNVYVKQISHEKQNN